MAHDVIHRGDYELYGDGVHRGAVETTGVHTAAGGVVGNVTGEVDTAADLVTGGDLTRAYSGRVNQYKAQGTLDYTEVQVSGSRYGTLDMGTFPAGAVLTSAIVRVTTAFDGTNFSTPLFSIGSTAMLNNIFNGASLGAGIIGDAITEFGTELTVDGNNQVGGSLTPYNPYNLGYCPSLTSAWSLYMKLDSGAAGAHWGTHGTAGALEYTFTYYVI